MSYCVSCKKKTGDIKKQTYFDEKNNKSMSKSICDKCGKKKSQFVRAISDGEYSDESDESDYSDDEYSDEYDDEEDDEEYEDY